MQKFVTRLLYKAYGSYLNILAIFSKKKAAKKAFEIFTTVRKGQVLPPQKVFLDTARKRFINSSKYRLQVYHWPGKKETVLLVHGWESNTFRWRNLIAKLQEFDYNIIAFDAPGHGYSSGKELHLTLYADSIQRLITTYNPHHLVAHSFGGMAVLFNEFRNNNDGIEKIVTIGSPSEFHEILAHYQKILGFNRHVLKAFENYIIERFGSPVAHFSSSRFVAGSTKKGLILHDELDMLAPFHASENVHAQWKNSTFIRTRGLGHSMHQPQINEKIVEFLTS